MTGNPREQQKRNGYHPITLHDVQPDPPDPFFANLDSPASRSIAAVVFLFIFSLSGNSTVAAPLVMLVLLACLLFRMNPQQRALTAVPLTFSAVRLATHLAGPLGIWRCTMPSSPAAGIAHWDMGVVWLPLFLATYLFFTSTIDTNTSRVVFWYALAVLLSGLLPGEGYTVVCAMLYYTLFFVILVTIVTDLSPKPNAARPWATPPEPARA